MKMKREQPAKESYFFRQGYVDLIRTIKGVHVLNKNAAKKQMNAMKGKKFFNPTLWFELLSAIAIVVVGGIMTIMTSMVHVFVLTILFLIVYFLFAAVWFADRIYVQTNRIGNVCPNPACQAKFLIPAYECPKCGELHDRLMPGRYGIIKRECKCGEKFPTTFLNGRGKLQGFCPICGCSLSGETDNRQYAIPVIGGPSVGKSCYINMTVRKILETAQRNAWNVEFIDQESEGKYKASINALMSGTRLEKTDFNELQAYQLMLRFPNDNIGRRINFYDISGEMFSSDTNVKKNPAFTYAEGFLFLIDPLTIRDFEMDVLDKLGSGVSSYGASREDFDDILQIMLSNLDSMLGLSPDKIMEKKLAVVINKCDIPTLEGQIGNTAVKSYMESHPDCKDYYEVMNILCRNFLTKYHSDNFIRTAERKFKKVQFFSCSALGHNDEGKPYAGINVEQPFMWLLSQVDSKIKLIPPSLT